MYFRYISTYMKSFWKKMVMPFNLNLNYLFYDRTYQFQFSLLIASLYFS